MKLLSAKEIAAMTGWHLITIYRKAKSGEIPGALRLGKKSLRFDEASIRRWIIAKRGGGKRQ